MTTLHKAVFLDRDGVINQTIFRRGAQRAPQDLSEWRWLPDVHEVAQTLQSRGYLLLVATNQPDVARGWQSREQVEAFHRLIQRELPVTEVYACFHDNDAQCDCRKPKPGMLLAASRAHGVDLARSYMVGDREGDIEAGQAAGCTTVHMRPDRDGPEVASADYEISALRMLLEIIR